MKKRLLTPKSAVYGTSLTPQEVSEISELNSEIKTHYIFKIQNFEVNAEKTEQVEMKQHVPVDLVDPQFKLQLKHAVVTKWGILVCGISHGGEIIVNKSFLLWQCYADIIASFVNTYIPPSDIFLTLGADPEFELLTPAGIVSAREIVESAFGTLYGQIGVDGAGFQVEFRPHPSETPAGLIQNIRGLIKAFYVRFPYELCISGHKYSLGFHVHFGGPYSIGRDSEFTEVLLKTLDAYVGKATVELSGSARGSFKKLGQCRVNSAPYVDPKTGKPVEGLEYRTMPTLIAYSPEGLELLLKLCHHIAIDVGNGEIPPVSRKEERLNYIQEKLGKKECKNLIMYIELLKELSSKNENVTIPLDLWSINLNSCCIVEFNDGDSFGFEQRRWLAQVTEEEFSTLGRRVKVKFFGFASSRGMVSNLPGFYYDPHLAINTIKLVQNDGKFYIGLPHAFRNNPETFEKSKDMFVLALKGLIKSIKGG